MAVSTPLLPAMLAKRPAPSPEDASPAKRPATQAEERLLHARPGDPMLLFNVLHSDCDVIATYQGQHYVAPAHLVVLYRLRELHDKCPVLTRGLPASERRARIELAELPLAALDLLLSTCYCPGQASCVPTLAFLEHFDQIHELLGPGYAVDTLCCAMAHWLAGPGHQRCAMQLSVMRRLAMHCPNLLTSPALVQLCAEDSARQLDRRDFYAVLGALLHFPIGAGTGGSHMSRELKSSLLFTLHARWLHAHPEEPLSDADLQRLLEAIAPSPKPLKMQLSPYASTQSLALRQLLLRTLCAGDVAASPSSSFTSASARLADQPPSGSPSK
jgi:hypothetical protein